MRQLQPDQHEDEAVEDEPDHLPGRQPQDPAAGSQDRAQPAADDEAGRDRREHARQAESIGREIGRERDDDRDQDLDRRVVEPPKDLARDTTDDDADGDPADRGDDEPGQRFGEDEAGADGEHRGPIGDQRGRVVEQRLAFDERPDDPRRPESAEDRRGRQRVGRADDRTERERGRPAQAGDERVRHHRDEDHREQDQADREADERREVRAEIADRGFGRGGEEQRRQEDEQDQVGLEVDAGKARDEGQRETAQHEQCRIRHADAAGDLVHDRDGDEDQQDGGQDLHDGMKYGAGGPGVLTLERLQGLACPAWHRNLRPASWSSPT